MLVNDYEASVGVHLYDPVTGNRFSINNTYKIVIEDFATLDELNRRVNLAVRDFVAEDDD